MPIINQDELLARTVPGGDTDRPQTDTQESEQQSGFGEVVGAWFQTENTPTAVFNMVKELDVSTGSLKDFISGEDKEVDPNFNPADHIGGYELEASKFAFTENVEDVEQVKARIDKENINRDIIARGSTAANIVGGLSAVILDPISLIPVVRGVQLGRAGVRFGKGFAQGAGFTAAGEVGAETILQSSQETRTVQESFINVSAGAILGGIIGGSIATIAKPARTAGEAILNKALKGEEFVLRTTSKGNLEVAKDTGVGAAEVSLRESEGLAYINDKLARAVTGAGTDILTPTTIRGLTSRFGTVKAFTNKVFMHSNILNKETRGEARGEIAELLIRQDEAAMNIANNKISSLYTQHTGKGIVRSAIKTPEGKLSFSDFNLRISRGLRDENLIDDIAEVNESVKIYRAELDKYAKQMQELGILPKDMDPDVARNYLSRVYDTRRLSDAGVSRRFVKKVSNYIRTHNKDGTFRSVLKDSDVADVEAKAVLDNIMGQGDRAIQMNSISESMLGNARFSKERVLLIPDAELEEFLVNDAQQIVTNYSRRASATVNMQKAINELGFDSLSDMKLSLKSEKDLLLAKKDTKQRIKIEEDFKKDINLLDDMYRLMLGQLKKPHSADRFVEALLRYQFIRLLGGVTLSSLPEFAMAPFKHGLLNTLVHGYLPMIRDFKTSKLTKDQFKDIGVGIENEQNNILRSLSGTDDTLGSGATEYDRMMNSMLGEKVSSVLATKGGASGIFAKISGIEYLTSFGRRLSAQVSSAVLIKTLRKVESGKKLSKREITGLAQAGISESDYGKVIAQFGKVQDRNGSTISNHHLWDDGDAKNIFRQAVQNQVESIIIKPGKGDLPLIAHSSNIGKVIFQFRAFVSAASGRILLSGMQRRDATTLMGLTYLIGLGSLTSVVKDTVAGREVDLDPTRLLLEGVSNSGMLGMIASMPLDLGLTLFNDKSRRFTGNRMQSQVLGPTPGLVDNVGDFLGGATDGNWTNKDSRDTLRLLPYMNIFYIQALTNRAFPKKERK